MQSCSALHSTVDNIVWYAEEHGVEYARAGPNSLFNSPVKDNIREDVIIEPLGGDIVPNMGDLDEGDAAGDQEDGSRKKKRIT